MPTISLMAQKGGAGKTTISVHLAALARERGLDVLLIDLDPQRSAMSWNASRAPERRLPVADAIDSRRKNSWTIIDTPPHANATAAKAADAADLILIPCRPARFDLDAMRSSVEIAKLSRKPYFAVLNAVPHNGGSIGKEAEERLREWGVPVYPRHLIQRAAYSHAVITGEGVHEWEPSGKAAAEIRALFDFVLETVKNGK